MPKPKPKFVVYGTSQIKLWWRTQGMGRDMSTTTIPYHTPCLDGVYGVVQLRAGFPFKWSFCRQFSSNISAGFWGRFPEGCAFCRKQTTVCNTIIW